MELVEVILTGDGDEISFTVEVEEPMALSNVHLLCELESLLGQSYQSEEVLLVGESLHLVSK